MYLSVGADGGGYTTSVPIKMPYLSTVCTQHDTSRQLRVLFTIWEETNTAAELASERPAADALIRVAGVPITDDPRLH